MYLFLFKILLISRWVVTASSIFVADNTSMCGFGSGVAALSIYIYIIQILSVCVCVCLSSIGGQTTRPIMTKFGTHMRIDLGMVPTKNWPHEWPGSVGSLGPISESGLSCQLLLWAVVWQMTSQWIRRRNDVVFAAFNQPVSVRPMNVQKINQTNFYPPHPGGSSVPGGLGVNISKVRENSRKAEKIDKKKNLAEKITKTCNPHPTPPHPTVGGGLGAKISK